MAGYDLEIIKLLLLSKANILLVGDPRQVTYHTHDESKYSKYKDGNIIAFINTECKSISCEIDTESLNVSHRNNQIICEFSSKLFPNCFPCSSAQTKRTGHDGIFLVKEADIEQYLYTYKPIQLRDSIRTVTNSNYMSINFGNSKGATFNRVLIYPTKPMFDWLKNHDSDLVAPSRAKFYVAITRAIYSVAIIMNYNDKTNIEGVQKFNF